MTEAIVHSETLRTADGEDLAATRFEPTRPDGATVVVGSAVAVPRTYYASFAAHLATHGLRVLTFDYRGIGGSRAATLRGYRAGFLDWARLDLDAALEHALEAYDSSRLLYVGHSLGGQVLPLAPCAERLDAGLLVAPASGTWRNWRGLERLGLMALFYVTLPAVARSWGYVPGRLLGGEDVPREAALDWARWGRHPDYLHGHVPGSRELFARLRLPLRVVGLADDRFAPPEAIDQLASWYTSAAVERVEIAPADVGASAIGHFGFFRRRFEDTLWRDAVAWLRSEGVDEAARAEG